MADNNRNSQANPDTSEPVGATNDHLMTFDEVAAKLRVSKSLIEAADATGRLCIPVIRPTARKSRFRASDVQRVIRGEVPLCTPEVVKPEARKRLRAATKRAAPTRAATDSESEAANA
jgi:hypothetical protein